MRRLYSLLFVLVATTLTAQNLPESRRSSYYTFIYKITNGEARLLYKDIGDLENTFLHTLVDFYPSDSSYAKNLPTGHYLFVRAEKENIEYSLESVNNVDMRILSNHRDLMMVVNDSSGNVITDTRVQVRSKKIYYQPETGVYRIPKSSRRGLVTVTHRNHVSYFEVDRLINNTLVVRTGRKVLNFFPIRHLVVSPILYVKSSVKSLVGYGHVSAPGIYHRAKRIFEPRSFDGYMVLNKPKYKPGDTVRFKAFVTTEKGRAIARKAALLVDQNYPERGNKRIKELEAIRRGVYANEFVLSDTLNLTLDRTHTIRLRDKRFNTLQSASFMYEDYELKANIFSLRKENPVPYKPGVLYLKGTDSNDQPLYDVTAEVLIRPRDIEKFYTTALFVPDTLWFHKVPLEALGETKVVLPDTIFPPVKVGYEALVTFVNADRERHQKTLAFDYDHRPFPVQVDLINDTLVFSWISIAKDSQYPVVINGYDRNAKFFEAAVRLPFGAKRNVFADHYEVVFNDERKIFPLSDFESELNFSANRTKDSLLIRSANPGKIIFHYFLFKNKHLIMKGTGQSLNVRMKANHRDSYSLAVQYVWAGESKSLDYNLPFNTKSLHIAMDHPALVYPGQKTTFSIAVQDALGNPVPDADLTAFAITRKFGTAEPPAVPYREKERRSKRRLVFNEFNTKELLSDSREIMDWAYWRKVLGLDSIAFYKFLFPENGWFEYKMRGEEGIEQFAPFVVDKGKVVPVHVIYVDNQPVYYSGVGTLEPYSFRCSPGNHKISLRLLSSLITIDRVTIDSATKTIFSIELDSLPPGASKEKRPYLAPDQEEWKKLRRYFIFLNRLPGQDFAYLRQGPNFHLLSPGSGNQSNRYYTGSHSGPILTGPFVPGPLNFTVRNKYQVSADYEPGFSYEFKDGFVKMRERQARQFTAGLFREHSSFPFLDQVYTQTSIEAFWKSFDRDTPLRFSKFPAIENIPAEAGRLLISYQYAQPGSGLMATFLLNLDDPDEYYIFPSAIDSKALFTAAPYQAVFIFDNHYYVRADSITVKPHGLNYYDLKDATLHEPDTFSQEVMKVIRKWAVEDTYVTDERRLEMQRMRMLYYRESAVMTNAYTNTVSGRIVDYADGSPIPGVNVLVKGTPIGTVTDMDGYYTLKCPDDPVLVFSFVGYQTVEADASGRSIIDAQLNADVAQLSEVVVTAMSVSFRRNLTSSLQGRVAGLTIDETSLANEVSIAIRGMSTHGDNVEPLVVVDGRVTRLSEIDPHKVTAIEVLKGDSATALFGSRASVGVILISTKPGVTKADLIKSVPVIQPVPAENVPGSALRKNFRDYAFWQPLLRTDKDGRAEFTTTFPDDITGWNAYVLGMASKRRTGQTGSYVQSYKPLFAQIVMPGFLLAGDSSSAVGKITSYTEDTVSLNRKVLINELEVQNNTISVIHSHIDTLKIAAQSGDTIAVQYSVYYNQYEDGELRKVPVYQVGTMETKGMFLSLRGDTTFTIPGDQFSGTMKLYAQADLLDVLLDEARFLKQYPYECNEQLASRLRGLLLEKQIKVFTGAKFRDDRDIEKTIKKLVANQNRNGSWDWWDSGKEGSFWISVHAGQALALAAKAGFKVAYDRELLINYVESVMMSKDLESKTSALLYLLEQGEKPLVQAFTDSIHNAKNATTRIRLAASQVAQLSGQAPNWKWIDSIRRETIKGNYYWGEENERPFDNAIMNTLLVYKLKERADENDPALVRIRNYFLEKRKQRWRNTYESSLILETILPSLLREKKRQATETMLTINSDAYNQEVTQFPFEREVAAGSPVTITKKGSSPVYFTAYEEKWNLAPLPVEKDFRVSTSFEGQGNTLKAGKPIKLKVEVKVNKDAEYVMIEVPIPAGCSYESKDQPRAGGEVHREYYHYKTNIYCQHLKKGAYTYEISLLPRFSGRYTLNPAVVECMYFPTIYGRNGLSRVGID